MEKKLLVDKLKTNTDYQTFFKSAMKKFNVTSIASMDDAKKKEFFDYVDKNYTSKNESKKKLTEAVQIKVDTSAYKRAHGKEPKGTGLWAFGFDQYTQANKFIRGSYTKAKQEALFDAKKEGNVKTIYVMS